jgi:bisphosphoglycerate-dependent phosphoglycerate mutase
MSIGKQVFVCVKKPNKKAIRFVLKDLSKISDKDINFLYGGLKAFLKEQIIK